MYHQDKWIILIQRLKTSTLNLMTMKFIQTTLILMAISLTSNCTVNSQIIDSKLVLKITQMGTYDLSKVDIYGFYLVDVKLCNYTDSTCTFFTYSCASTVNLLTDSKEVIICWNECAGNYPQKISIKPGQIYSIPIIIKINKNYDIFSKPFKVGLVLLHNKKDKDIAKVIQKMKDTKENIIWSDLFTLQRAVGKPYNIY